MQFTTPVPTAKSNMPIDYDSVIVSLGSCFAVNMAEKFSYYKFRNTVNPFGILFHPPAITKLVRRAIQDEFYSESEVFFHHERWHCFDAHSDLSHTDRQQLIDALNENLRDLKTQLESASHFLVTYGTAWVYREKVSGNLVANCHKVPQIQFQKELLSIVQIGQAMSELIQLVSEINPRIQINFTVSPVRHLKDGFVENLRSKSHLIAALHEQLATENWQRATVTYFPSYEILMDELRDYRFYDRDLIHPNALAVDYIWQRFVQANIASESYPTMEAVNQIRKAMAHRPFHPDSESHRKFLENLAQQKLQLQEQFSHLQF